MKRVTWILCLLILASMNWNFSLWSSPLGARGKNPPKVIQLGIKAHGGMENWRDLRTVIFHLRQHKYDAAGDIKETSERMVAFPTSGHLQVVGLIDSLLMTFNNGQGKVFRSEAGWILDQNRGAEASYLLPTLNYIWSLPWKLLDPGLKYQMLARRRVMGQICTGVRITFEKDIGETPEDWYQCYFSEQTGRLIGILFKEHAPENPGVFWLHLDGYHRVGQLWFPKSWKYYSGSASGTRRRLLKSVELIQVKSLPTQSHRPSKSQSYNSTNK